MEYRQVNNIKTPVSRIVYGCATKPMIEGENVNVLLDEIFALGINAFDTAENYGLSEISLGNWIKHHGRRDDVVIISKGCHPYERDRVNIKDLRADLEQSLKRLDTDYIDMYFLHRDNLSVDVGPIVEVLNEYLDKGKIRAFGGSNWTHTRITEANEYAKNHNLQGFTISSPNFGLCDQIGDPFGGGAGCVTISGPSNKEARKWYVEENIPVFAYSSLGRGFFSGRVKSGDPEGAKKVLDEFAVKGYCYPENFERLKRVEELAEKYNCTVPQIALAWLLSSEVNTFAIMSSTSADRFRENLKALEIELSKEEKKWINLENIK